MISKYDPHYYDAAVMFSGGVDSACALGDAALGHNNILAIIINYGHQGFNKEYKQGLRYKIALEDKWRGTEIDLHIISLPYLYRKTLEVFQLDQPLIMSGIPNPPEVNNGMPWRNFIFTFTCLSVCEMLGIPALYLGCGYESEGDVTIWDSSHYFVKFLKKMRQEKKDLYEAIIDRGEKLAECSLTKFADPEIISPMLGKNRYEYVKRRWEEGYPLQLSWSCYLSGDKPCGECSSCQSRKEFDFLT